MKDVRMARAARGREYTQGSPVEACSVSMRVWAVATPASMN